MTTVGSAGRRNRNAYPCVVILYHYLIVQILLNLQSVEMKPSQLHT